MLHSALNSLGENCHDRPRPQATPVFTMWPGDKASHDFIAATYNNMCWIQYMYMYIIAGITLVYTEGGQVLHRMTKIS